MAEGALVDRLDQAVEAILARKDATAALADPELARLVVTAAEVRHCPDPAFRARLRANLERRTTMTAALATTGIREGFTTITPFVTVREAGLLDFLVQVFGAEQTGVTPHHPPGLHREVRVGTSMMMISEGLAGVAIRPAVFHVYVEDVDAVFARALAAGGESLAAPEDRPYGERSGYVKDPFGNHWYIATHLGPSYIPEGFRTVTPFVHPKGVSAYIEFLKQAFGAVEEFRHASGGLVMHARIRIGNGHVEMGDTQGAADPMPSGFYLYVGDPDIIYQQAITAGAKAVVPVADQPYGDRMGAVEDSMGHSWLIARSA